jgi:hypothetical protein
MPRTRTRTRSIAAALTAVAALGAGGTALAQTAGQEPTTVTVTPVTALKAGDTSPFDVAGVKAIRRGKTIPAGYVLPGYRVQIEKGAKTAGAALRFSCPGAKRLQSFAIKGQAGFSSDGRYVGHRDALVSSFPSGRWDAPDGIVYAVCR